MRETLADALTRLAGASKPQAVLGGAGRGSRFAEEPRGGAAGREDRLHVVRARAGQPQTGVMEPPAQARQVRISAGIPWTHFALTSGRISSNRLLPIPLTRSRSSTDR